MALLVCLTVFTVSTILPQATKADGLGSIDSSGTASLQPFPACDTQNEPLKVTIAPVGPVALNVGQTIEFEANVSGGSGALHYQWYLNALGIGTGNSYNFTPAYAGSYTLYVKVTDSASNTATSNSATVSVECPPPPTYTITASAGPNGAINPSGTITVTQGETSTFTIVPNINYHVASVVVDGNSVGSLGSYTFINVQSSHTITAFFAIDTYAIQASAGANGTISPSGTISVNAGANQSFTIATNTGYYISDVIVDGSSVGLMQSYTFSNVQANHTISATFSINQYTIASLAGPSGFIDPAGAITVNYGANQSFSIAASYQHDIADVSVDGVSRGPVASYTFTNITSDHNITATFRISQYGIRIVSALGSPTPLATVTAGSSFTASVTSPVGDSNHQWACIGYSIDGRPQVQGTACTFINIQANHTVFFNWKEQWHLTVASTHANALGTGWYDAGTTAYAQVSVASVTEAGTQYTFNGWTGDASGASITSNSITMNAAKTATATWTASSLQPTKTPPAATPLPTPLPSSSKTPSPSPSSSPSLSSSPSPSGSPTGSTSLTSSPTIPVATPLPSSSPTTSDSPAPTTSSSPSSSASPANSISPAPSLTPPPFTTSSYVVGLAVLILLLIPLAFLLIWLYGRNKTIVATAWPHGAIAPSGRVKVKRGANQTFLIKANPGYHISKVKVDGKSIGPQTLYVFRSVKSKHIIVAIFESDNPFNKNVLKKAPSLKNEPQFTSQDSSLRVTKLRMLLTSFSNNSEAT